MDRNMKKTYKDIDPGEFIEETTLDWQSKRPTICELCGKTFKNVYTLASHRQQVHEGIKTFGCQICDAKFATKNKLSRHNLGVHSEKRDFNCLTCNNAFKTRDMLIKHQRTHFQGMGPFNCTFCDEVFKFKSGLDYHVRIKHTIKIDVSKGSKAETEIVFACSYCQKNYKSLKILKRHEKQQHENEGILRSESPVTKEYTCCYCLKVYKSRSNFEIHIKSHENDEAMENYEFLIENNDETFQEVAEEVDNQCEENETGIPEDLLKNIDESVVSIEKIETERYIEPLEFIQEVEKDREKQESAIALEIPQEMDYIIEEAEDYLIERDDGIDFYDTIIAEPLSEDDMISQDEELQYEDLLPDTIAEDDETEIQYDVERNKINVVSNQIISSRNSKISKQDVRQSICESCGAIFKNNSHLKRHVQRKHRKEDYRMECDVCGAKFLLNYDLKRHMIKHNSIRDFSCEICNKRFKTDNSLRNHIKLLHNPDITHEKKFQCQACDRSYFHQRHLDYHMRKHSGDQRYKCDICIPQKFFYYSDAVRWHRVRHHNEPTPFVCTICNKKFIHEKSLQTHTKEHQGGSKSLAVQCPICEKSVSEKRHLKRHMRGHASKEFLCKCGESFKERHQLNKHLQLCKHEDIHDT